MGCARGTELAPAGSLILVNPGQVHENGAVDDGGFAYRTLYVPPPLANRCLVDAGFCFAQLPEFREAIASDHEIFSSLRRLHLAVETSEPPLRLQTLLTHALALLFPRHAELSPPRDPPSPSRSKIDLVREYLGAHFSQKVSLDDLCRLTGLSAFHLVRSFRDQVGLPPCQYQLQRRVLHALSRLRQGMPIGQTAYEAGFADQSHLNRHFKRFVGVTPGEFRARRNTVQDG